MDNVQKRNICPNVPSSQTFRSDMKVLLKWEVAGEAESDGENLLQYNMTWPGIEHSPQRWVNVWAMARHALDKHLWTVKYDWLLLWRDIFRKLRLGFKINFHNPWTSAEVLTGSETFLFSILENIRYRHVDFKISCRVLKCHARACTEWHSAINMLLLFHIWKNHRCA
jgi:hypothetical protein